MINKLFSSKQIIVLKKEVKKEGSEGSITRKERSKARKREKEVKKGRYQCKKTWKEEEVKRQGGKE